MNELSVTMPQAAFGPLLRRWRTTRKMSQLDLALHSDVSQRHLSFLESGRARPSQQMVMQLSEALEIPLRERNTLLQAAGFAPFYRQRGLSDADMAPVQDALTRMLEHHDPYPAVVFDRDFNILMENRAFSAMLGLFGEREALWRACCPDGVPNLLRLTFHPMGARPYIRNFDEVGSVMLLRAYRETLTHRAGPTHAFIEEMRRDPTIPAQWHSGAPSTTPPPVLPLVLGRPGLDLTLFTMVTTFGTPHDITTDEIRVETFFPGDGVTESFLRGLA